MTRENAKDATGAEGDAQGPASEIVRDIFARRVAAVAEEREIAKPNRRERRARAALARRAK